MSVCIFTAVSGEDGRWVAPYLAEVERLHLPFAVHLDRCPADVAGRLTGHRHCIGWTSHDDPAREFTEQHKQGVFDVVVKAGYRWALATDIDEVYDRDARAKLDALAGRTEDYLTVRWVNLWGDPRYVRVDTVFASSWRMKLYNLTGKRKWSFDHPITNGAKLHSHGTGTTARSDIVCLHAGLMTRELREQHKARWDRIYSAAVGEQPYKFWDYCLDEVNYPPTVEEHDYR